MLHACYPKTCMCGSLVSQISHLVSQTVQCTTTHVLVVHDHVNISWSFDAHDKPVLDGFT